MKYFYEIFYEISCLKFLFEFFLNFFKYFYEIFICEISCMKYFIWMFSHHKNQGLWFCLQRNKMYGKMLNKELFYGENDLTMV